MLKNSYESIFSLKYFKKISLTIGFVLPMLLQGEFPLLAVSDSSVGTTYELQQKIVTGRVVDASNNPLIGIYVVEKGTNNGVITDADGKYSITVASGNSLLTFSSIGYESQQIIVGDQTSLNITLAGSVIGLDEVIVVGYGVQRKSDITGSITSVDVNKVRDVPSSNITKALQGKTAGVEIQNTSTRPGGSTQIRIRGNRSLSASNDPLIVVDGIPFGGSLNDISSDDIASLEVLKDASATVIYGSRGSNGVILIQTKRGKEGKLKVTYNGYLGVATVTRKYDVYNAEEYVNLRTAAGYTNYLRNEKESMLLGRETDWQDLVYQDGKTTNHEINLSGGTATTKYSFSGGYYNETGVLPEIGFARYTMRAAIDQEISKYVKIGMSTMNSYGITDGQSANPMWSLVSLTPLSIAYNIDGTLNERPGYDTEETYNPLTLADHSRWKEQNRRASSFNTFYAEVQILEGLKYKLNTGIDFNQNKYNNYYGSNTPFRNGAENNARVQNSDNLSYTIENILTFDKILNDVHKFNFTGLYSVQQSTSTRSRFDAINVPVDFLQYNNLSLAETVTAPNDFNDYSQWGILSYMGRLNYSLKDRYLVTLTGRADASSRLADGNKWHYYPAVALGWKIINESFMKNLSAVTNLKLRFGYGQAGNTAINPYSTLGGLTSNFYSFGPQGVRGYYVSTLPNKKLGWEATTTTNVGVDFGFIDDRITGSVDLYLQETKDLLLGKRLPASQGVPGSFLQNIGKTENRGLEIALNGDIIRPKSEGGFSWTLSVNLFLNREKIVALQDSITRDVGNGWFVGEPSSSIFDYEKIGIWQLGEEVDAAGFGAKPGDIKFRDISGPDGIPDGQITDVDRTILGSSQPVFQGGFTSSFEFKGFDLSIVGYTRVGGMIISTLHQPNSYINRLDGRRNGIKVDYWTPENPTNDMPAPNVNFVATRSSVLGYFDGSFLKIRSINLGYNVPKRLVRFIGDDCSVRLYSSVVDPFIFFSPYIEKGGVDPEPNGTGAGSGDPVPSRALSVGLNTPPTTKFIFGVNVKF